MKLFHCPCGAPKEGVISRSEPDDDLSVTILACRVTILACRIKLIHCPCGAPKEGFISRSESDDDLSVTILACRMKLVHCPCGAPREVFTSRISKQKRYNVDFKKLENLLEICLFVYLFNKQILMIFRTYLQIVITC
jgi:hypothetical protein